MGIYGGTRAFSEFGFCGYQAGDVGIRSGYQAGWIVSKLELSGVRSSHPPLPVLLSLIYSLATVEVAAMI